MMRLIIVDGLDGVGKDTHARLIKKRYETMGDRVIIRSHPESDNLFGRRAKKALLGTGKVNRLIASVFYALDVLRSLRLYYQKPQHETLIMVRYLIGTAYLPGKLAKIAYQVFDRFVPTSSYMFFLDATPRILSERIQQRKEQEMFETYEKLVRVRKRALGLVKGEWYIIDTEQSIEDTFATIEKILNQLDKSS
jgi:dTMP kinase